MQDLMNKLTTMLEKHLVPVMNKMANNRYFGAIRDSLIATMGLTIIGSLCLLIATFPFPQSYVEFIAANPELQSILMIPFNLSVSIISVYVAFGIGYYLSESYNLNKLVGGITALFTFLIMAGGINSSYLGAEGMFTAIIAAIFNVEVTRFCVAKNIAIKMPKAVSANIAGGFTALIPCTLSTLMTIVLIYFIGFDVNSILATVLTPIITLAGDSIFTALIYVILATLMWFAGLHPQVLASLLTPAWTIMSVANMNAYAAGMPATHIFVKPFFFTFVFIGGQCGTLALNFIMLKSKSKTHRDLAKLALPAGLFNINEPMLFGLPIVLNPTLIIPALIGQVTTVLTTWLAFASGIVPPMVNPEAALWNLPAPIAAAISTFSWQAVVLLFVNMLIQGLLYIPFYRIVEKDMVAKETAEIETN